MRRKPKACDVNERGSNVWGGDAMKTMKTMTKMTTDGILMKNECGDAIKNRDTSVPVRLGG